MCHLKYFNILLCEKGHTRLCFTQASLPSHEYAFAFAALIAVAFNRRLRGPIDPHINPREII